LFSSPGLTDRLIRRPPDVMNRSVTNFTIARFDMEGMKRADTNRPFFNKGDDDDCPEVESNEEEKNEPRKTEQVNKPNWENALINRISVKIQRDFERQSQSVMLPRRSTTWAQRKMMKSKK